MKNINKPTVISSKKYFEKKKEFSTKYFYHNDKKNFCKLSYRIKANNKKSIIWIHGFNDYFYHYHISDLLYDKGYDFYHLTLHNYVETLISKKFYTDDLKKYFIDIDNSLDYIISNYNYDKVFLYGHSTGGLISSIYSSDGKYKKKLDGLILNSPFYDFYNSKINEFLIKKVGYRLGKYFPKLLLRKENNKKINGYSNEILKRFYFEPHIKLVHNSPVYAGWITTVVKNQRLLKNNKIKCDLPIIVFFSDKSNYKKNSKHDSVLDVKEIKKYVDNLSKEVTKIEIENGIHDIFTSEKDPLDKAIYHLFEWLDKFN